MLSHWDKLIISRFTRSRREKRTFIRMVWDAKRRIAANERATYRRVRGARLNVGQVLLVAVHHDPRVILMAVGAVLLYVASMAFVITKHLH